MFGHECKTTLGPGDLVITEVFADHMATSGGTGADDGKEWFEIYNATGGPIELDGLRITHSRPDGARPSTHTILHGSVALGSYFTLGNAVPESLPPYVDYGYGTELGDMFNVDGGKLALSCGTVEIDSATYRDVKQGHARELTSAQAPDYTVNDAPASWCQADDTEFETGNFGTPGAESDCQPIIVGQCQDGGAMRDSVPPGPGDLVITELMPSPVRVSDAAGEWIELKVVRALDLNGVGLRRAGDAARPEYLASASCIHVRAGSYIVFARSSDPLRNGGLPRQAVVGTFKLPLVSGTSTAPGDVAIVVGTTVIDAVRWTRSTSGKAMQLDPARTDPLANDLEGNFCDATTPYGPTATTPDQGTPGAANPGCAGLPTDGMCDDRGVIRRIVKPAAGQLVISELLANPANVAGATDAQREWFEVSNTGAAPLELNELAVGRAGTTGRPLQSARCISVPARGHAVFARSADPAANGGLPPVAATFAFALVDIRGDVQISDGGVVLDAVTWSSAMPGIAQQLDPVHLNVRDNDLATHFCAATATYGDLTNRGGPATANPPCR
jgi:hypothetical protein